MPIVSKLTIRPDGTFECLHTEAIDLAAIGRLQIERASNVEFNDATQEWDVVIAGIVRFSHRSRAACLAWEHDHFNQPA